MPIEPKYDPLSISEITQEQIEARNKKTVPVFNRNTGHTQAIKHHTPLINTTEDNDLKDDFLNLLLSGQSATESPHKKNAVQSTPIQKTDGTKEFFLTHNECEEKKENLQNNVFSFSIVNSMAGEVQLNGEFSNGKCLVRLTMKNTLTVKEKAILAQILQASLKSKLNTEVELQID